MRRAMITRAAKAGSVARLSSHGSDFEFGAVQPHITFKVGNAPVKRRIAELGVLNYVAIPPPCSAHRRIRFEILRQCVHSTWHIAE